MQSNQRFIGYGAHKLFRRPSWKMTAYGLVPPKNIWDEQNSSVNFLVRAEFLNARPPACQTARQTARPPLVITIPHSLNG